MQIKESACRILRAMFKYSKDGVSVLTIQDVRRKKQSGLFPIKIQIVHNRVQRYYNTGKDLSIEEWEKLATSKSRQLIHIRSEIKNSFEKVESVVRSLVEEGNFSFDNLNIRLGKCANETLNMAYKNKINSLNRGRGDWKFRNILLFLQSFGKIRR